MFLFQRTRWGFHAIRWLASLEVAAVTLVREVSAAPPATLAPATANAWERIEYPSLPIPGMAKETLSVGLRSLLGEVGGGEGSQLCFDLIWSGVEKDVVPQVMTDPSVSSGRLHLADGTIVQPTQRPEIPVGIGNAGGVSYSRSFLFPWQKNAMDEAWFELVISGQTYWIELPYGFARNPADPLPASAPRGAPVFLPTMQKLGAQDRLVPWIRVIYDFGKIQNDWRLSLRLANSVEAQARVGLYREDLNNRWNTDTPRTSVEIKLASGHVVAPTYTGSILHEDRLRRSDNFTFEHLDDRDREWGKAVIKIDQQTYECVVPSSLFKQYHGVTNPPNVKWLPRVDQFPDR